LYAGTEIGLFVSHDFGSSFAPLRSESLPAVSVHDIIVHPRENDLILGTHGRGLFIFDDATPIQELSPEVTTDPAYLFDVRSALRFTMKPTRYGIGDEPYRGPNPPYGALITYSLKEKTEGDAEPKLQILDENGVVLRTLKDFPKEAGVHRVAWDIAGDEPRPRSDEDTPRGFFSFGPFGPQVPPGTFRVRLTVGSTVLEKPIVVKLDPTASVPEGTLQEQYERTVKLRDLRSSVNDALRGLDSLKTQIEERRKTLETQKKEIPEALKTEFDGTIEEIDRILDGLARPTGKPFWSEGPRLSNRLQDLFGQLNGVLAAPTRPQEAYFGELLSEYGEKMGAVNEFFGGKATALSRLLEENGAPGLLLPASIPLVD
ncbi:MAG: hypothetical protein ACRD21_06700, partial [Vicinamibacteria bacterium]